MDCGVRGDLLGMSPKGEDSLKELSHPFHIPWNIVWNISECAEVVRTR